MSLCVFQFQMVVLFLFCSFLVFLVLQEKILKINYLFSFHTLLLFIFSLFRINALLLYVYIYIYIHAYAYTHTHTLILTHLYTRPIWYTYVHTGNSSMYMYSIFLDGCIWFIRSVILTGICILDSQVNYKSIEYIYKHLDFTIQVHIYEEKYV